MPARMNSKELKDGPNKRAALFDEARKIVEACESCKESGDVARISAKGEGAYAQAQALRTDAIRPQQISGSEAQEQWIGTYGATRA